MLLSGDCSPVSHKIKPQIVASELRAQNPIFTSTYSQRPGWPLNGDINGRILNTDLTSRIFDAKAHKKSGLRVDGAQVPCRAPRICGTQRQRCRRCLWYSGAAIGEDPATAYEERTSSLSCRHERRICIGA